MTPAPLALSLGDPAGTGPEITARAWRALRQSGPAFLVIGDRQALESAPGGAVPVQTVTRPEDAAQVFAEALPVLRQLPRDPAARSDALYGAWLCGSVLGQVGMALHHKLCHVLGGSFNLPHAEVHTVVLPQATAFNAPAVPQAMARVARALGSGSAARGLFDLARDNGAPVSLRSLGMAEAELDRAADLAAAQPYWNPRPVGPAQRDALRELLQGAWEGRRPD